MTTSRIGRKPVPVPTGVEIKIQDKVLTANGTNGSISIALHPYVNVSCEKNEIIISQNSSIQNSITGSNKKLYRSILGTIRARIFNMVLGVSKGFERKLMLIGVGYKAQMKGKILSLSVGYSHPTDFDVPEGITIETPTQTEIIIKGKNKQLVGEVAAEIRSIRSPEPYKGKGVRYSDEIVEIKEAKKK